MMKKFLAGLLSLTMALSLLPAAALADEAEGAAEAPAAAVEAAAETVEAPAEEETKEAAEAPAEEPAAEPTEGAAEKPVEEEPAEEVQAFAEEETPEAGAVAKIGDTAYATLQEAIGAAKDGDTVELVENVTENVTIAADKELTLDLNGYTLNGGTVKGTAALTNKGTVTITDSSEAKTGTIKREDQSSTKTQYYTVVNEKIMTIAGGTITNNSTTSSLVINFNNQGNNNFGDVKGVVMKITGGELKQTTFIALKNDPNSTMIIEGGEISFAGTTNFYGNVEIKGGNINGGTSLIFVMSYKNPNGAEHQGRTTISGGTLTCGAIHVFNPNKVLPENDPVLRISGENTTLNGNIKLGYGSNYKAPENSIVAVSGGTFKTDVSEFVAEGLVQDRNGTVTAPTVEITRNTLKLDPVSGSENNTATLTVETNAPGKINWISSDPYIAVVDGNGTVTANNGGDITVYAYAGGMPRFDESGYFIGFSEKTVFSTCEVTVEHTHNYEVKEQSTCYMRGTQECTLCHKRETLPFQHNVVEVAEVEATCTKEGTEAGTRCSICDTVLSGLREIPKADHTTVIDKAVAPTCTGYGATEGVRCTVCQTVLEGKPLIPTGHKEEILPAKAATCTEMGLTEGTKCSVCDKVLTEQKPAEMLPHTVEILPAKAATTTEKGLTEGQKCSVCGEVLIKQTETPMLPLPTPSGGESSFGGGSSSSSSGSSFGGGVSFGGGSSVSGGSAQTTPVEAEEDLGDNEAPLAAMPIPFADVDNSAWYREAVAFVYKNKLMTGDEKGNFAPDANASRAMIARVLHRLSKSSGAAAPVNFTDISGNEWHADSIAWAASTGIVRGFEDNSFRPDDAVTREQIVIMLYRFAQNKGYNVIKKADLRTFADVNEVGAYAREAMSWAVANGIVSGRGGNLLAPTATAKRAEIAKILQYFTELYVMD